MKCLFLEALFRYPPISNKRETLAFYLFLFAYLAFVIVNRTELPNKTKKCASARTIIVATTISAYPVCGMLGGVRHSSMIS